MTEYSKKISFWKLLESKKIVIPIIQRDYAQGREGKEFLRERFLGQLFDALREDAKPLVLDFVYGSVEEDTLYPLDGQQRLTTLWLLHWYLALCAGTLEMIKKCYNDSHMKREFRHGAFATNFATLLKATNQKTITLKGTNRKDMISVHSYATNVGIILSTIKTLPYNPCCSC